MDSICTLRWLKIVSWCARPRPLNIATESRVIHATIEFKMEYVACARMNAPGLRMHK